MIIEFAKTLIFLWFLHCLADFALQSDAMAKGKRTYKGDIHWIYWMSAHASIQGLMIWIFFPVFWPLAIIEFFNHFIIDYGKCKNYYSLHVDQAIHLIWRVIFALAITLWVVVA